MKKKKIKYTCIESGNGIKWMVKEHQGPVVAEKVFEQLKSKLNGSDRGPR